MMLHFGCGGVCVPYQDEKFVSIRCGKCGHVEIQVMNK